MRLRRVLAAFAVLVSLPTWFAPPTRSSAAGSTTEIVALVVEGVGYGHGRGMSQWGAYGRAVNGAQAWTQILDAYYAGTTLGSVPTTRRTRVRLVGHDNATIVGVVSIPKNAMWAGRAYGALHARATSTAGRYDIWASATPVCASSTSTTGWTRVAAGVSTPIRFTTNVNESTGAAGDVLGLCTGGAVVHYRGSIELTRDSAGAARVVNELPVEAYLRGVVSREVSTSWGNAGGGRGMHALRAQAVAARSFAVASNRYAGSGGYATTCDTTACQAYGGAARRSSPTSPLTAGVTCESGNSTFECANTNRAVSETAGRVRTRSDGTVAVTEFSASNGPRTAGGTFPAVNDPWDDVASNPNHRWTRIIDVHLLASGYGLGVITSARTEADPTQPYDGVWDNRLRVVGTAGTAVIPALTFRSQFGLPSHGFIVRAVARGVASSNSMRLIGDSVGVSITGGANTELPALLDGVFTTATFDAVQSRCTSGCTLSGVAATLQIPTGTDLALVELGYNAPTDGFAARIDDMMRALRSRGISRVVWVNLSERARRADYVAVNQALAAATSRWPELRVLDWRAHSAGTTGNRSRWFASDGIHLTATGQAELARFIRDRIVPLAEYTVGSSVLAWDRESGAWVLRTFSPWSFRDVASGTWVNTLDRVANGDFDRDGADDDVLIWNIESGGVELFSTTGNILTRRTRIIVPTALDDVYVGDFDSDGFRNDVLWWDHTTGDVRIDSVDGFTVTPRRSTTRWPLQFDTLVVADFDADGRFDDAMLWDRIGTNAWQSRRFSAFTGTEIDRGTWPAGYEFAVAGDWDQNGRVNDLVLVDTHAGTTIVYSWAALRPTWRANANAGAGFDVGVAGDFDDDRDFGELLLFDVGGRAWATFRFTSFAGSKTASGAWPASYDRVLAGAFG